MNKLNNENLKEKLINIDMELSELFNDYDETDIKKELNKLINKL